MLLVPCTTVKARRPMRYAGRDRFKASLDHTASSRQQSKKNLAKKLGREHTGVLKGSQARFHNWKQEGGTAMQASLRSSLGWNGNWALLSLSASACGDG